jgi:hypothetical protein
MRQPLADPSPGITRKLAVEIFMARENPTRAGEEPRQVDEGHGCQSARESPAGVLFEEAVNDLDARDLVAVDAGRQPEVWAGP